MTHLAKCPDVHIKDKSGVHDDIMTSRLVIRSESLMLVHAILMDGITGNVCMCLAYQKVWIQIYQGY